ncbi:RHS repeat-associated core domain-containing protein [Candidatus Protochlamydia phocaeensis]|uniref:RHS repeat-associated core domain-containing protein n=1 Tax=Candidatus Protochlamydia phocaeensis TaxID=1414722 RepID=UPI0008389FED|nr:RHS repeat-associated core domain-containing protein [Candidatus Protochlamydia phocaeensis]
MRRAGFVLFFFLLSSLYGFAGEMASFPIDWDLSEREEGEAASCWMGRMEWSKEKEVGEKDFSLSAECEPLTTVAGCVNVASGQFFQTETDLIGSTIDPIKLTRYYDSGQESESLFGMGFGSQFPLLATEAEEGARHSHALICEREGFMIPYRGINHASLLQIDPRLLQKGYTNVSRVAMSGHANFVNWEAVYKPSEQGLYWTVRLGNGAKRTYGWSIKLSSQKQKEMGFPTKFGYLLSEEKKPNGNTLRFDYCFPDGKPALSKVRTLNRSGQLINELTFTHSPTGCLVASSCGKAVYYAKRKGEVYSPSLKEYVYKNILQKVESSQKGVTAYQAECDYHNIPKVTHVAKAGQLIRAIYSNDKVKSLQEPLGEKGELISSYTFAYGENFTIVENALKQSTIYYFDPQNRIDRISEIDQGQIVKQQKFSWSTLPGQEGWLKAKAVLLGDQLFHLTTMRYDSRGNITRQTRYGNLTGEKPESFLLEQKRQMDSYAIDYEYDQNGYNLLKKKATPEGLSIAYAYEEGTNLLTEEVQAYGGLIQERVFQYYDPNGQPFIRIEDDGSGLHHTEDFNVTYRRVTYFQPETNSALASFGKPKEKIETALNRSGGEMLLLKTTRFDYDAYGNEISQKIYNAKNEFCYEINKAYDDRQRLIAESNPLGEVTCYAYDDNNNKIKEDFVGGKQIRYFYDQANRLIRKEEHHRQNIFTTTYAYNSLNQLIAETDPYGHQTTYAYDRLGNQIACVKPLMQVSGENPANPSIARTYNALGQMISQTDERGFTTCYAYNSYGSPTRILYPDQSEERFIYYPSGWLKQKWHADGTSVQYAYDPKGRLIKEVTWDENNQLIKQETYTYKGNLLKSKQDAMGVVTYYEHDGAGRKILEVIGSHEKTIAYAYDDLGRIVKLSRCSNGQELQSECYQYDWLDRLVSKVLQDSQGQVYAKETYAYDRHGNQISKTVWHADHQTAVYRAHYQTDGSLAWQEDPLGNRTEKAHHHDLVNALNQRVRGRTIKDPLKRLTGEVDDAYQRLAQRSLFEGNQVVSSTSFAYDTAGNLVKQSERVMHQGNPIREYTILSAYDSCNRLASQTEWPANHTTRYAYDGRGRLIRKDKPDGVSIHYAYDALGRLAAMASTDGTIGYQYSYDLHDNPIEIKDVVHHTVQKRAYDQWNRLIKEELSAGAILHYTYDALDRLIQLTLPDGSFILYSYDAFHLWQVQRINAFGKLCYTCNCLDYDQCGRLLKERSPAGEVDYTYDLLGRAIKTESPYWTSTLDAFDPAGNLLSMMQKTPSGEQKSAFSYDRFDHLAVEAGNDTNCYQYDSLGNCLAKNGQARGINALNQVTQDEQSAYSYDVNGNLIAQSHPPALYRYDALNRLISCEQNGALILFGYDAFNRCILLADQEGSKQLLYQGDQEIGSLLGGKIQELRIVHPNADQDKVFAIELKQGTFFPVQDFRHHLCALRKQDGSLAQWKGYSAFGSQTMQGEASLACPWGFGNRREVAGLVLFAHRFYNPRLMRWQTADPIGFEDGLNLYQYVHNNPFRYQDPDGQFAFLIPLAWEFGVAATFIAPSLAYVAGATLAFGAGWAVYELNKWYDNKYNQNELEEEKESNKNKEKFKFPKNPDDLLPELPRDDEGCIQTADNLRIRPEQHEMKEGDTYNPRHHEQHYHVETRRDPSKANWKNKNTEIIKPPSYYEGMGTGFLPGEYFPGMI